MTKHKAIIIGAGSIGAMKPDEFDNPESIQIYTHAHACYSHPNIELIGIIDCDYEIKATRAALKWNTVPYLSIKHFYTEGAGHPSTQNESDIVIVAVDTDHHYDIIKELIPYKPKVIICEKPFCSNYEQALEISQLCNHKGINLIINYTREFVPELKQLSNDLKNGDYGDIYNFTLRYSRGLLREASHAFYWCLQTFGEVYDDYYMGVWKDSPIPGDYSSCVTFKSRTCNFITFIPIGPAYSTYNADIYTEKGRIELLNNWKTIRFHELTKSTYGNYPATNLLFEDKQTQLNKALIFLLDYAIKNINESSIDICTLDVHKHLKLLS